MFGFGKKKELIIVSPLDGVVVPVGQVSDQTFSEDILGKGVAIRPSVGVVKAPADAEIAMMFETGHAVSLTTDSGADILIHVGLDTVQLKGEHYTAHKANGDRVKTGDKLMTFDMEAIAAKGYDIVTPVVVCNPDSFAEIRFAEEGEIHAGEPLIFIKPN
ncbi:hypothetical protein FACS189499_05130 [Clostridia bacterium]|nr:hypothetical protein FACS189499_05130 [Clostridia bacterium]